MPVVCTADIPRVNPAVDPSSNKLIGYQFDSSGNTKIDADNRSFIYDSENKQAEVRDLQTRNCTEVIATTISEEDVR
jgi:hypothetical protein